MGAKEMGIGRFFCVRRYGALVFAAIFAVIPTNYNVARGQTQCVLVGDRPCTEIARVSTVSFEDLQDAISSDSGVSEVPPVIIDPAVGALRQLLLERKIDADLVPAVFQTLAVLGQTTAIAGAIASSLTQDIISGALDSQMTPDAAAVSPLIVGGSVLPSSQFMVSGYKLRNHDGYSVESSAAPFSGSTPGFEEESYGLTLGGRFDGSEFFGATPNSVTIGIIGNYTHTDIDIDAPAGFPALSSGGSAEVDSWSVGTFGLVTDGRRYGLLTVTGTFGSPETQTDIVGPVDAEFNNYAIATSAMAGVLVPLGGTTQVDLRGGLEYIYAQSDDFEDSVGVQFTDASSQEFAGSLSARLFSVIKAEGYDIRPFVQAGLSHRFYYENELKVDGVTFAFDDADTSVFGRVGMDFAVGQSTQAYVAVRGDMSEDSEAIAAQVGLTFRLD
jgi:hypothetical protein